MAYSNAPLWPDPRATETAPAAPIVHPNSSLCAASATPGELETTSVNVEACRAKVF